MLPKDCFARTDRSHRQPRVINTELGAAIADIKKETLRSRCGHRPVQFLNNLIEPDHRPIQRRVKAKQGFREFQAGAMNDSGLRGDKHNSEEPSAVVERE